MKLPIVCKRPAPSRSRHHRLKACLAAAALGILLTNSSPAAIDYSGPVNLTITPTSGEAFFNFSGGPGNDYRLIFLSNDPATPKIEGFTGLIRSTPDDGLPLTGAGVTVDKSSPTAQGDGFFYQNSLPKPSAASAAAGLDSSDS